MPVALRQCATTAITAITAITAVQAVSTMFAMGAMLGRLGVQHQDATARRLQRDAIPIG